MISMIQVEIRVRELICRSLFNRSLSKVSFMQDSRSMICVMVQSPRRRASCQHDDRINPSRLL